MTWTAGADVRGDFEPHTKEQGPGAWEAAREEAQHQASQLSCPPLT